MLVMAARRMPFYESQERRSATLNIRLTPALRKSLTDLARLWTHLDKARTGDPKAEVSIADVVNRLLTLGAEGAWAEFGGRPLDETAWKQLLKTAPEKLGSDEKK